MKTLIDANVILRYVLNDIQEMADKASLVLLQPLKSWPKCPMFCEMFTKCQNLKQLKQ